MLSVLTNGRIELTRGDTADLSITIKNIIQKEDYVIKENDTLKFSVKKSTNDELPLVQKSIVGSNTFHINPSDTKHLAFGEYVYDVELTTESGDVYTVIPTSIFKVLTEVG